MTGNAQVGLPPVITVQPLSQAVLQNDSVTFEVVASSSTALSYEWQKDGIIFSNSKKSAYTIQRASQADEGVYSVRVINAGGNVVSANAYLTVLIPPTVTTQPQNQAVAVGNRASFSVVASGTPPLSYQWSFNGVPLAGAIGSSLELTDVQIDQAGDYTVAVANSGGAVTSGAARLLVGFPPTITTQPRSQAVASGQNGAFTVAVAGTEGFNYWWYFEGSLVWVDGFGPSSTFTLTNLLPASIGHYAVAVYNLFGSATSAVAELTFLVIPDITAQPQNQAVKAGQDVAFSVTATGPGLSYQWNRNGLPLAGATDSVLNLNNAQPSDAGEYRVMITNAGGSVLSDAALLMVSSAPMVAPLYLKAGERTSTGFSLELSATPGFTYVILASTNCRDWTPISTNLATTANVVFTDAEAANHAVRFYRAQVQ